MDLPQDQDSARNWMVALWHEYGARFDVFVPQEQPAPTMWEPIVQEPDRNGSSDPQIVKHWRILDLTKRFLAERYSSFGILNTPSLRFDCLVRSFHRPVPIDRLERQSHGWPEKTDPAVWYENSIRMGIFYWQVGFSCTSRGCRRWRCKMHMENPKRKNPVDIYSLIALFEGFSVARALTEIQKWFGGKLRTFHYAGIEKNRSPRYAVPKRLLLDLINPSKAIRHQHVDALIQEAADLIRLSPVVEWHPRLFSAEYAYLSLKIIKYVTLYGIKSPAIRLYLWLLVRQEEEASHNRFELKLTIQDIVMALDVDRSTVARYRDRLQELGLLEISQDIWKPKY
jgi:hypothetical protein